MTINDPFDYGAGVGGAEPLAAWLRRVLDKYVVDSHTPPGPDQDVVVAEILARLALPEPEGESPSGVRSGNEPDFCKDGNCQRYHYIANDLSGRWHESPVRTGNEPSGVQVGSRESDAAHLTVLCEEVADAIIADPEKDGTFTDWGEFARALAPRLGSLLRLHDAIRWALGEHGDFTPRPDGAGTYWWRTELRQRAFGVSRAAPPERSPE